MFINNIQVFMERDLRKLKDEINAYADEADMWKVPAGISNSAGNLALHLAGNIRFFIGNELGKTGYVRDRDAEFNLKNVPRDEINRLIDAAIIESKAALEQLKPEDLSKIFPVDLGGQKRDTANVLLILLAHLSYHLGQVNYHRRLLTQAPSN